MLTSTLRLVICAVHFTGLLYYLGNFVTPFNDVFLIVLLVFFCVYGASFIVSLVTRPENNTLVALVLCLVFSVLNGFGPSYYLVRQWNLEWLWGLCYGLWATEALFNRETSFYDGLYNVEFSQMSLQYRLDRYEVDIGALVAIGVLFRLITYAMLRFTNRDKQQ
jgi:ABC-type transport system involved in multi-copper enzyme maturation permease subunit